MKLLASLFLALAFLLVAPEPAAARSGSAFGWKVVDVALVRPLMLAVSVTSNAFFLGTLPLTFPIGVSEDSAQVAAAKEGPAGVPPGS